MILQACPCCREFRTYAELLAGRLVTCQACRETFRLPSSPQKMCQLTLQHRTRVFDNRRWAGARGSNRVS